MRIVLGSIRGGAWGEFIMTCQSFYGQVFFFFTRTPNLFHGNENGGAFYVIGHLKKYLIYQSHGPSYDQYWRGRGPVGRELVSNLAGRYSNPGRVTNV